MQTLPPDEVKGRSANYLQGDLKDHIASGAIAFKLNAQVAEEGDTTDNATVRWPESRKVVELGEIRLDRLDDD